MGVKLDILMYHYIRDFPRTKFPQIKGMLIDNFICQLDFLCERYEVATLESALAFINGKYEPSRDLCILTFDDGFKEHYTDVLPALAERRIQGLFFPITSCIEDNWVAPVHKNHFLMAYLDFPEYRETFIKCLAELSPETETELDISQVRKVYRWDSDEIAAFKYLLNFTLPEVLRNQILDVLFDKFLGDEEEFSNNLYLSWHEARQMQSHGMIFGGHSHRHMALTNLDDDSQYKDLDTCKFLLKSKLESQDLWPFSYPYGKRNAFNSMTVQIVKELGYCCSFTTEYGTNEIGQDPFCLQRIDCKDV